MVVRAAVDIPSVLDSHNDREVRNLELSHYIRLEHASLLGLRRCHNPPSPRKNFGSSNQQPKQRSSYQALVLVRVELVAVLLVDTK